MTAAIQAGSTGSTNNAPTMTSDPRGSFTMAERKRSCSSRKTLSRSATAPAPRFGPPDMTTRVGSPPVCESMIPILWTVEGIGVPFGGLAWSNLRPRSDAFVDDRQYLLALGARQRHSRHSQPFGAVSALLYRKLDIVHKLHVGVEVQQWRVPSIDRPSLIPTAGGHEVPKMLVFAGERQSQAGDPTGGAEHGGL